MAPDLNSLPPSRSPSLSNGQTGASDQAAGGASQTATRDGSSPNVSRVAASAALPPRARSPHRSSQVRSPPFIERRRSSIRNESPTATTRADHNLPLPRHHDRSPSLGELHQELESEHEAQVNRLLSQIRAEQQNIAERERLQPAGGVTSSTHPAAPPSTSSGAATTVGDSTAPLPPRSRTSSFASNSRPQSLASSLALMPSVQHPSAPRGAGSSASASLSRQSSIHSDRSTSRSRSRQLVGSPAWGAEAEAGGSLGLRDEVSFLQVETANVTRENQMLKGRIRELERMLADRDAARQDSGGGGGGGGSGASSSAAGGVTA